LFWYPCPSLSNIPWPFSRQPIDHPIAAVLLIAIGGRGNLGLVGAEIWFDACLAGSVDSARRGFHPALFANSLISSLVGSILVGFGFSGVIVTMDLIGAKIMDEDTQKHNLHREGIISNALGFMNRLNSLFTGFAFYLVFRLFGFESGG